MIMIFFQLIGIARTFYFVFAVHIRFPLTPKVREKKDKVSVFYKMFTKTILLSTDINISIDISIILMRCVFPLKYKDLSQSFDS